jgi:hypothetical protein
VALPTGASFLWEAPTVVSKPADGATLFSMVDLSGNAFTPGQGVSASRATWRADGWATGVPAAEFDGIDDAYQFTGTALSIFTGTAGGTIVSAFRDLGDPASALDRQVVFFSRNASSASRFSALTSENTSLSLSGAVRRVQADAELFADSLQGVSVPSNRTLVVIADTPNGTATSRVDGTISRTVPIATAGTFDSLVTGSAYVGRNSAGTRFGKLLLAALALYPHVLTSTEMAAVDAHFAAAPYNLVPFGPPVVTATADSPTQTTLTWPAVPTATSYDVERNGVLHTTTALLTVTITGAAPADTYRVRPRK